MPTLDNDRLVFRFPELEERASVAIEFQRTLRIPDTAKTYSLPPGLGRFPVRHTEDHAARLPSETARRGGVILPMWQAEALWLNFRSVGSHHDLDFPVAIKVAAGKINAVSGEQWRPGLFRKPQDYIVLPDQPWLDGFAIEPGVIRQFVAMPLGDGYTVEGQLTGKEEWGGLQIQVIPLKPHVWKRLCAEWEERPPLAAFWDAPHVMYSAAEPRAAGMLGLGAGGRMRQHIYPDSFNIEDWDVEAADRVFVSLIHARDWMTVTGEAAPNEPPSAKEYSAAGLPWYDYYGADQQALPGGKSLAGVKSVAQLFKAKTGATLPNSGDVETGPALAIKPKARRVNGGNW